MSFLPHYTPYLLHASREVAPDSGGHHGRVDDVSEGRDPAQVKVSLGRQLVEGARGDDGGGGEREGGVQNGEAAGAGGVSPHPCVGGHGDVRTVEDDVLIQTLLRKKGNEVLKSSRKDEYLAYLA